MSLVWSFYLCSGPSRGRTKTERKIVCLQFSSHIECYYLIHWLLSVSLQQSQFLLSSDCLFYGSSLWDASRSHGLVWALKILACLTAKLSWHLDWQDCKRTEWEGEVMPSSSVLSPFSLSVHCLLLCSDDVDGIWWGQWSGGYHHLQ